MASFQTAQEAGHTGRVPRQDRKARAAMRGRKRKSIARWLFPGVGLLLLLGSVVAALPLLAQHGWISPDWEPWVRNVFERALALVSLTDDQIKQLLWLGGIAASLAGAAFTLLASWHFAEMNLAQRLEDLKKSNTKDFLVLQPRYLVLARRGLGSIPPDIETSRLTLLRSWVSWWSEREKARVLAASAKQIGKDASALSAAAHEAEQRKITAHLIRGYQLASEGDEEAAFDEFQAATRVTPHDVLSRDIAAGWASE